jgi:single-stranded DNA-binding protein
MTDISGSARLAANPELKPIGQGDDKKYVCAMRVRFLNPKQKKDSDEWDDRGFWADINVWGPFAEPASRLFERGDRVTISGNLVEHSWPDRDDPEVMHRTLQVDTNFIAPYLPDLESLRYKPRKTRSGPTDEMAEASHF